MDAFELGIQSGMEKTAILGAMGRMAKRVAQRGQFRDVAKAIGTDSKKLTSQFGSMDKGQMQGLMKARSKGLLNDEQFNRTIQANRRLFTCE